MTSGYLVAAAGPRNLKIANEETKDNVGRWIYDRLTNIPVEILFCGLAEGFEEAVAKFAFKLDIPVFAIISYASYGQYYWGENSVTGQDRSEEFQQLLDQCSDVHLLRQHHLFGQAAYDKAKTLVSFSDTLLAYPKTDSELVTYTIDLAQQSNLNIESYPQRNLGGAVTMQEIGLG